MSNGKSHQSKNIIVYNDTPILKCKSKIAAKMCRVLSPTNQQAAQMLHRIKEHNRITMSGLAAVLNTQGGTLRTWIMGGKIPGYARRLIWIVAAMTFNPHILYEPGAWLVWKHKKQLATGIYEDKKARKKQLFRRQSAAAGGGSVVPNSAPVGRPTSARQARSIRRRHVRRLRYQQLIGPFTAPR